MASFHLKKYLVIFAAIAVSALGFFIEKNEYKERISRATACTVDGRQIPDGNNFTRAITGPCTFYKCQNGNVLPLAYECIRNGQCYPLGDKFKIGCTEHTCQLTGGRFDYAITGEGCPDVDGVTCRDVNTSWNIRCFQYRCNKEILSGGATFYRSEQISWGCEWENQCHPENHTIVQNCRSLQCQRRGNTVGYYTLKDGCQFGNVCIGLNETQVIDCRTMSCQKMSLNNIEYLSVVPVKVQCMDDNDKCHDSGVYFPIDVNGNKANCTCTIDGFNIHYQCPFIGG